MSKQEAGAGSIPFPLELLPPFPYPNACTRQQNIGFPFLRRYSIPNKPLEVVDLAVTRTLHSYPLVFLFPSILISLPLSFPLHFVSSGRARYGGGQGERCGAWGPGQEQRRARQGRQAPRRAGCGGRHARRGGARGAGQERRRAGQARLRAGYGGHARQCGSGEAAPAAVHCHTCPTLALRGHLRCRHQDLGGCRAGARGQSVQGRGAQHGGGSHSHRAGAGAAVGDNWSVGGKAARPGDGCADVSTGGAA
ncbi:hypothetical protein U9M48_043735 [Paspalum notatum var. saurae]|uniref:Uncharacterized protein n=1 Tax=Paspalum notatum var. saurae TaxID=547442 RepID=A0AAQ3UXI1_PASNO